MLDSGEWVAITKLAAQTEMNETKNYYILMATDQTFSGLSMMDFRCH
jgi:hypothetical protein